jgi:serine/threonine-protein kinase
LESLVAACLFKAPAARPTAADLARRLPTVLRPVGGALSKLQDANRTEADRIAVSTAAQSAAQVEAQRRKDLMAAADEALAMVAKRLATTIGEHAPLATWTSAPYRTLLGHSVRPGPAELGMEVSQGVGAGTWGRLAPPFEVLAASAIGLRIPVGRTAYGGRSHSLWFCDAQQKGQFRWFETAFMFNPFIHRRMEQEPFALQPCEDAAKAVSPMVAEFQVAWPFCAIDPGNEDEFIERWLEWFAQAAAGHLGHPTQMPERDPQGSWRRS